MLCHSLCSPTRKRRLQQIQCSKPCTRSPSSGLDSPWVLHMKQALQALVHHLKQHWLTIYQGDSTVQPGACLLFWPAFLHLGRPSVVLQWSCLLGQVLSFEATCRLLQKQTCGA